ncbi:acyl-CoA dehydrogenase family protein [Pseudonocardia lutea]|uniref:Acyl-CoA dehydrogenase family protein n=1 Tax=Pseudonocardia lutea TaxID=2172015 RepID=A0ABW1HZM7_9PSEU
MTDILIAPAGQPATTPSPDELLKRAVAFRDRLRAGQAAAEEEGAYPAELHEEFLAAGFFHILHPRRYGGLEHDLETFFRVVIEISRGDPAVGWALCLSAGHAFHLASYFGEQAQEELLGGGTAFVAPSRTPPTGKAVPVDGGYRVTGRWDYCSGSRYATHAMVVAMVPGADGPPAQHMVVVPRSGFTILDDWGGGATLGMQGTSSNTITVEDVFVPAHHAVPYDFRDRDPGAEGTPGYRLHRNPLYLGRTLTFFNGELVATQVGNAFAALDEYEELMSKAASFPPRRPRVETPEYQQWFGEITALADASEIGLLGAARRYAELGRRWERTGEVFTVEEDARIRGVILQAAKQATQAVDIAFSTAGSSAAKRGSRMQKYFRDAAMFRTHIAAQYDVVSAAYGRFHFGAPLTF